MARTRKKSAPHPATEPQTTPAEDTSFNPVDFDPAMQEKAGEIVHGVAESTRIPDDAQAAGRASAPGFIANPSATRRESHASRLVNRLPSTMSVPAGDLVVKLIDKGDNLAGVGIRVELPEGGRSLTDDEKAIIRRHVRGEDGENTGYGWNKDVGMWHKPIVRDGEFEDQVPPSRPVAVRLDAERRVSALAEALREHQADPAGFAERVKQQREQAAGRDRIPD